jgi:putative MFS transporter
MAFERTAPGTGGGAGEISTRIDRLPATRTIWIYSALLGLGFFFELYDLFLSGYVAPGLVKAGILTPTTPGLFGTTGVASFIAALFAGLPTASTTPAIS